MTATQHTGTTTTPQAATGTWVIDPVHSFAEFAVKHMMVATAKGRFTTLAGTLQLDAAHPAHSSVVASIDLASVDTGEPKRDAHLRSDDFFGADQFPQLTFRSTRVERKGKEGYVLHGQLTLKGVTKPVALPFTIAGAVKDPWGNTRFGVQAQTKINRRDFGINYGSAFAGGGLDVGNEVTINLQLEAVKAAPKPATE